MKVLIDAHMIGLKQTGNERYWKNLVLNLKNFIHPKNIILYCNLEKKKLPKEFQDFTIFTPKYKNGLYRIFFGFNQAIKKHCPDLIHVQNFAPFKKTIPVVNTVHDVCFKTCPETFNLKSKLAFYLFFYQSLKLSDFIITPSYFVKKMLLKYYSSIKKKKIFITYEAVDSCFYYIKNKNYVKKYLKNKFNLNKDYYLIVGEIQKRKNPFKIIDLYNKKLKKQNKNSLLIFVGPNRLSLKQTKEIKILGYVDDFDLNYLYNGAKGLIYLSECEGFGLPIVEALKTKTPIISSNLKVFQEIKKKYQENHKIFNWKNIAKKVFKIYSQVTK